jgi:tetratricopeptide (TPR) repeat protein
MMRVISLVLLVCASAYAQPRNPLIARGQEEYRDVRFEEALQTLSAALVRSGNSDEDLATIYRLLGFTYLALQREEEAAGAYRHMLAYTPDFQPGDELSPRFRDFFARVRAEWEASGRPGGAPPPPVSIQHRSPAQSERGTAVTLTANVEDPTGRVAQLILAYRQGTQAVFRRVEATRGADGFTATIPGDAVAPPLVEYYFEALDTQGLPIAARGDVAAPLRTAVAAPGGNVLEEWWFWTLIGGGAVAVGVAIILGVALSSGGQAPGTLVITVE